MTTAVCQFAPKTTVVAVHLESLDHGTVSRDALRQLANRKNISLEKLLIPVDGEKIKLLS